MSERSVESAIAVQVFILTNRNIWQLKRAIDSVQRQRLSLKRNGITHVQVGVTVVINTFDSNYRELALELARAQSETVSETVVSESNGLPGKGHNAVLDAIRNNANNAIHWAIILDGDDALSPNCIATLANSGILAADSGFDTILDGFTTHIFDKAPVRKKFGRFGTLRPKLNPVGLGEARSVWFGTRTEKPVRLQNPLKPPAPAEIEKSEGKLPHFAKCAHLLAMRPQVLRRCDADNSLVPISFSEDIPLDDVLCEATVIAHQAKGNLSAAVVLCGSLVLMDRLHRIGSASELANLGGPQGSDIRQRVAAIAASLGRSLAGASAWLETNADAAWSRYQQLVDPPFYPLEILPDQPDYTRWIMSDFILPEIKKRFLAIESVTDRIESSRTAEFMISGDGGEDVFDLLEKCGPEAFPGIRVGCLSHLARRAAALELRAQALFFAQACIMLAESCALTPSPHAEKCRKIREKFLRSFES